MGERRNSKRERSLQKKKKKKEKHYKRERDPTIKSEYHSFTVNN